MNYLMGHYGMQLGPFIKTKSYKLGQQIVGERVNREITHFHLLHWHATKVVKVVVCTRTRILLSLLTHYYILYNRIIYISWLAGNDYWQFTIIIFLRSIC